MTINVVVATYDVVVLGCDSLSSRVETAIFPYKNGAQPAVDAAGVPITDTEGNALFALRPENTALIATSVMGGVQKMFVLIEDDRCDCSIAAVTSGMAALNGVTIAELAGRYRRQVALQGPRFHRVDDAMAHFLVHMRALWQTHADTHGGHAGALRFLVAGYCSDDTYTKVLRVSVDENEFDEQFPSDTHSENCGIAWDGQSNFASRLLMGIDGTLQLQVSRAILDALNSQRQSIVSSMTKALADAGVAIPDGLTIDIDEVVPGSMPWTAAQAPIDVHNLPIQTAVELVSALVNAESGMQKFVIGIPVVGGRTRIGLLRRNVPFATLNEPDLAHTHVGYATDA